MGDHPLQFNTAGQLFKEVGAAGAISVAVVGLPSCFLASVADPIHLLPFLFACLVVCRSLAHPLAYSCRVSIERGVVDKRLNAILRISRGLGIVGMSSAGGWEEPW